MKLIPVETLTPSKTRANRKDLLKLADKIMQSNARILRVEYSSNEYVSLSSAYAALRSLCKRYLLPATAVIVDGGLYIIRTDI